MSVEVREYSASMELEDDTKLEMFFKREDSCMLFKGFNKGFQMENRSEMEILFRKLEDICFREWMYGVVAELNVDDEEREEAKRFLYTKGFFLPEVEECILEVPIKNLEKAAVLTLNNAVQADKYKKNLKKTESIMGPIVTESGDDVREDLSLTLLKDDITKEATLSTVFTERVSENNTDKKVLSLEYFYLDDDDSEELVGFLQLVLPLIEKLMDFETFEIPVESVAGRMLFEKLFAGTEFTKKTKIIARKHL